MSLHFMHIYFAYFLSYVYCFVRKLRIPVCGNEVQFCYDGVLCAAKIQRPEAGNHVEGIYCRRELLLNQLMGWVCSLAAWRDLR